MSNFISDEEMAKSEQPSTTSDLLGSITHNIPLAGIAQKAGSAFAAGAAQLTPDAVLKPEYQGKSFTELYKMNQDKVAADQAAREERSPIASTIGSVIGSLAAPVPLAATLPAAAARVGLNVADQATRADTLSEAEDKALTSGAISVAGEALIPGASKLFKASAARTAKKIAGKVAPGYTSEELVEALPWSPFKKEGVKAVAEDVTKRIENSKNGFEKWTKTFGESDSELEKVTEAMKDNLSEKQKQLARIVRRETEGLADAEKWNKITSVIGAAGILHLNPMILATAAAKMAHGTPAGAKLENMAGQALGSRTAAALQTIAARKATQD